MLATSRVVMHGGYLTRSYLCPASDVFPRYHRPVQSSPRQVLMAIEAGTVTCRYCGELMRADSTSRANYTAAFVITEDWL